MCPRKCHANITIGRLNDIHEMFWAIKTYNKRRQHLYDHIVRLDRGERKPLMKYFLPTEGNDRIQVCLKQFCR